MHQCVTSVNYDYYQDILTPINHNTKRSNRRPEHHFSSHYSEMLWILYGCHLTTVYLGCASTSPTNWGPTKVDLALNCMFLYGKDVWLDLDPALFFVNGDNDKIVSLTPLSFMTITRWRRDKYGSLMTKTWRDVCEFSLTRREWT